MENGLLYTSAHIEFRNEKIESGPKNRIICINHITNEEIPISNEDLYILQATIPSRTKENHIGVLITYSNLYRYFEICNKFEKFLFAKFIHKFFITISKNILTNAEQNKFGKKYFKKYYHEKIDKFISQKLLIENLALNQYIESLKINTTTPKESANSIANKKILIGSPTKDRPDQIKNLLDSIVPFLKNTTQQNNTFILVDDSSNQENLLRNQKILKEFKKKYKNNVFYADRTARLNLALKISDTGNIPDEITKFALLGESKISDKINVPTGGSARNTFVLASAGNQSIQFDDDMVLETKTPTEIDKNKLCINMISPRDYWLNKNFNDSADFGQKFDIDIIEEMTKYLGKNLSDTYNRFKKNEIVNNNYELIKNFKRDTGEIIDCYLGARGNSGMLFITPFCFGQKQPNMTRSDLDCYKNFKKNGCINQAVSSYQIYRGYWCITMNIAIEEKNLTPFFSPIQREDDTIFGVIRNVFFENGYSMQIPGTLLHNKKKGPQDGIDKLGLKTTDVIISVLTSIIRNNEKNLDITHIKKEEKTIQMMKNAGEEMLQISKDKQMFSKKLEKMVKESQKGKYFSYINMFSEMIYNKKIDSEDWIKDMIKNIIRQRKLIDIPLKQTNLFLWDIPVNSQEEKLEIFREWVRLYGMLMIYWPKMFETAKMLNEKRQNPIFESPID